MNFWRNLIQIQTYYLPIITIVALLPLPGLFGWHGDWTQTLYHSSLANGEKIIPEMLLSRPALFGLAATPFHLILGPVSGIQAFSALSSAWLAMSFGILYQRIQSKQLSCLWRCAVVLSAPIILHSFAMWAKPLAAAGVLMMFAELTYSADPAKGRQHISWAAIWFAFAVATHESTILYLSLLIPYLLSKPETTRSDCLFSLKRFFIAGFLIVGIYRLILIFEFGLASTVDSSPTVSYRDDTANLLQTAVENIRCTIGPQPLWQIRLCALNTYGFVIHGTGNATMTLSYLSGAAASVAGTLFYTILPFFFFPKSTISEFKRFRKKHALVYSIGALLLIIFHAFLSPYPSSAGICQNGLLPLQMILLIALARVHSPDKPIQSMISCSYLIGSGGLLITLTLSGIVLFPSGSKKEISLHPYDWISPDSAKFHENAYQTFNSLHGPVLSLFTMTVLLIVLILNRRFFSPECYANSTL